MYGVSMNAYRFWCEEKMTVGYRQNYECVYFTEAFFQVSENMKISITFRKKCLIVTCRYTIKQLSYACQQFYAGNDRAIPTS